MMLRAVVVPLFAACLLCVPARASQPEGLAGKIITNADVADITDPLCGPLPVATLPLECYDFFGGSVPLSPDDTVTVDLAIVPFQLGTTALGLDEGANSTTFVAIVFSGGSVMGLPLFRRLLQRSSVSSQRKPQRGGAVAWIDSISIVRRSAAEYQVLDQFTASACSYNPDVSGGGIIFAEPPRRLSAGR